MLSRRLLGHAREQEERNGEGEQETRVMPWSPQSAIGIDHSITKQPSIRRAASAPSRAPEFASPA
jgi:hypothetical protein